MKIAVDRVHSNPNRNLQLNPLSEEGVASLKESIVRNGWWDNVVVRPHPTKNDHYQLAYGHHRLAALKALAKIDPNTFGTAEFIVRDDLSDWQMYCFMVDENETQSRITPAGLEENVRSGVVMLEHFIKESPTLEAFRELVPENRTVLRGTVQPQLNAQSYSKVRNAVIEGRRIGKDFLQLELPGTKSKSSNALQVALDSYYSDREKKAADQAAEAKRKAAELAKARAEELRQAEAAKRAEEDAEQRRLEAEQRLREEEQKEAERVSREKEASERRQKAAQERARKAQEDAESAKREAETRRKHAEMRRKVAEEEAAKAQAEADRLAAEHAALEAHAEEIAKTGISQKILRSLPSIYAMTEFAGAVKRNNIPSNQHEALARHILKEMNKPKSEGPLGSRGIPAAVNGWWYTASGAAAKARQSAAYNSASKKAQARLNKTIDAFIGEVITSVRKLQEALEQISEFAEAIENHNQAAIFRGELETLSATADTLAGKLVAKSHINPDMSRIANSAN
jgi:hypothetical protein